METKLNFINDFIFNFKEKKRIKLELKQRQEWLRLESEKQEQERLELAQNQQEQERLKLEQEQQEQLEQQERIKLQRQKQEELRLSLERQEQDRLKLERERQEQERLRLEQEQREQDRLKLERERQEQERLRLEQEQREQEQQKKEQCSISNEEPSNEALWFTFSEKKPREIANHVLPIECTTSFGNILYLETYPSISTRDYDPSISIYFELEMRRRKNYDIFNKVIGINDYAFALFQKSVESAFCSGNHTINVFIKNIEEVFELVTINSNNLYSSIDLKPEKKDPNSDDYVKYIDQNVKGFLKNNQVYAGLAYLKDVISSITYMFGVLIIHTQIPETAKIILYPTAIRWIYRYDNFGDGEILFNKIAECLVVLLMNTNNINPIISFYKNLHEKITINLKTDVLVYLIEAFLKHSEIQLVEKTILQLKKREPQHPIISIAEKNIRRFRVLDQLSNALNMNISDIQSLTGIEFEKFLENQFIKNNLKVERTKGSGDFGADIIVETISGTRAAIQAKRYKQKVNLKAVQEVVASLAHYNVDFGIVITTSGFFQSAIDLAQSNNVELWDEDKLIQFLSGDFSFSMLADK